MRTLITLIIVLLVAYLAIVVLMASQQTALVFHPTRTLSATPAAAGLTFRDVTIEVGDDDSIHGWYVPAAQPSATILFFHGNAGNISHRLETLALFHDLNVNVLIIDYRGYGQSTGSPSESGSYDDALAAWNWLIEDAGVNADQVIIYGRSLGGGIASWLAANRPAAALVLDSTFQSVADVARDFYWWLPVRYLLRIRYDTAARLPKIVMPIMIFHSEEDEIIGYHHGQHLYALAPDPKSFITLRGSHNSVVADNAALYRKHLTRLIAHIVSPHTPL